MNLGEPVNAKLDKRGALRLAFGAAATPARSKPERRTTKEAAPFCIRLTAEERATLERAAAGVPLGAYIRNRVLDSEPVRRRFQRVAVTDHVALARLLGQLGQSRLANNLNQLAKAANMGALPVGPEIIAELGEACSAIRSMRLELIRALGLREGSGSDP